MEVCVIGSWLAVCVYGIWWVDQRMCVVDAISLLPGSGTPWPTGMRALPPGVFALCSPVSRAMAGFYRQRPLGKIATRPSYAESSLQMMFI
jgi:hypothetical protein